MEPVFLTEIRIRHVRHLRDIVIPLDPAVRKTLILTGENSSGKTSVLNALAGYLRDKTETTDGADSPEPPSVEAECTSWPEMAARWKEGRFLLANFCDTRQMRPESPRSIRAAGTVRRYQMEDQPAGDLVQFLVNRKATQAFAAVRGDQARVDEIEAWFSRFQDVLRTLYGDPSLTLDFDIDAFRFSIRTEGRDPFDFGTMSMGYAAAFEIIGDLIMRVEAGGGGDPEGVVLIDEIETHLHASLQKRIVPILTELFPNLQFILTTHSPFVLTSAPNSVVYDLENRVLAEEGLTNLPYEGILEDFFRVGLLSREIEGKLRRYRELTKQVELTDADYAEASRLELDLDETPAYLTPGWAAEYNRLKLEFAERG